MTVQLVEEDAAVDSVKGSAKFNVGDDSVRSHFLKRFL